jgi:dienelactone hydrolase
VAEVALFHHAQGLTAGVHAFAASLRVAGHLVHTPDLFDGRTFAALDDGIAYARTVGFDVIVKRGEHAVAALPNALAYVGISLGVLPAQKLAQTRPGARGAILIAACVAPTEFGTAWPDAVPLQIHGMDADPIFVGDGDLAAARAIASANERAAVFLYPGNTHLFTDASLPSYDAAAATLASQRIAAFLATLS